MKKKNKYAKIDMHSYEKDFKKDMKNKKFREGFFKEKLLLDNILSLPEDVSAEKKRKCPICGHQMKKTTIGEQPKILIDVCSGEHGLWFDGGEVTQLIRHLAGEQPPKQDSQKEVISFLEEVFEASE